MPRKENERLVRGLVRGPDDNARVVDLRCFGRTDFVRQAKMKGLRCSIDHVWPIEFSDGWAGETKIDPWMFDGCMKKTLKRYGLTEDYAVVREM